MEKEILISASVGVMQIDHKFYFRVITAENYQFYDFEISEEKARQISERENLSINDDYDKFYEKNSIRN